MRRTIIMGLGLALTLAGTAAAQQGQAARPERGGQRGPAGPGMRGRGGPDGLLLKDITLTEGQRAQVAQLRRSQRDSMRPTREERQAHGAEVRAARERGDTAAVRAMLAKNREAMTQQRTAHVAALRNILTAEQRVQFDKNVAELQARVAERGERGPRGFRGSRGFRGEPGKRPFRRGPARDGR